MQSILIFLIRAYAYLLSPVMGPHCRFQPTCSAYAIEALQRYGVCGGLWYTLRRLLRCHPWHAGGCDPVPPLDRAHH